MDTLCEHFNKFINTLKHPEKGKGTRGIKRKLSMVRPSDERKYMMDKEILDKYIDLDKSCLMRKEKKEVMEMLYKYKEAFS